MNELIGTVDTTFLFGDAQMAQLALCIELQFNWTNFVWTIVMSFTANSPIVICS